MKKILEAIANNTDKHPPVHFLVELVQEIRPNHSWNAVKAQSEIEKLIAFMHAYPKLQEGLKRYINKFFDNNKQLTLYTDYGIASERSFWVETNRKLAYKIIPPLHPPQELTTVLGLVFHKKDDYEWVDAVPNATWIELFKSIGFFQQHANTITRAKEQIVNSILVLSQRITAIGLEQDIIEKLPDIDNLESPFFALNKEINNYTAAYLRNPYYIYSNEEDYRQILVLLRQCEESIAYLYKNKEKYGISLRLTHLMRRLEQHVKRIKILLAIVQRENAEQVQNSVVKLFKELVQSNNEKYSITKHFSENLSLLAFKVIENTSKKGEHYITDSISEYWKMFQKAMGGGFIVAFLCLFKTYIYYQHFPPFGEAFFYSMNYSLGFVLIHLLGFTLATKQPAMTASTIAASLDSKNNKDLSYSVDLLVRLSRTQFIALAGNVIVAFPVAYILGYLYFLVTGYHFANVEKANKMIDELHIIESPSLLFAGIAGIFLMTSGLIGGYYDNKVVYEELPQRLKQHPFLNKIMPIKWLHGVADYLGANLGALASNVYLGIFLGITATLGFIFGLNIDIRHITFASGNFGMALVALGNHLTWEQAIYTTLGIIGIGIVNTQVSFGLSILAALRSRNISLKKTITLFGLLTIRFFINPLPFFFPIKPRRGSLPR
jgi:site-specific recombinase